MKNYTIKMTKVLSYIPYKVKNISLTVKANDIIKAKEMALEKHPGADINCVWYN